MILLKYITFLGQSIAHVHQSFDRGPQWEVVIDPEDNNITSTENSNKQIQ